MSATDLTTSFVWVIKIAQLAGVDFRTGHAYIQISHTHTQTHTEHHYGEQCAACGLLGPGETRANEANSNLLASGVKVIHFCPIPYAA